MSDQSKINQVMALLAKAEATEFEEEAATYLAKAQELMIKHAIDQSQLTPPEKETITEESFPFGKSRVDQDLMFALARVNDIKALTWSKRGQWGERGGVYAMSLIGTPTDIAYVQALYASLVLQREAALGRERRPEYINGRTFNHSFRVGFGDRVEHRLYAAKQTTVESTPGTALVLVGKKDAVEKYVKDKHPKITHRPSASARSYDGYDAGSAAGSRADVSGGRNNLSQRRAAIR